MDIIKELQQWAKSNGIDSVNVENVLKNMDAGKYSVLVNAIEKKDFNTVSQLYNQALSHTMESFSFFNNDIIIENNNTDENRMKIIIKTMPIDMMFESYRALPSSVYDCSALSLSEMQTLIYEAFDTKPKSQFSGYATNNQQSIQPQPTQQPMNGSSDTIQQNDNNITNDSNINQNIQSPLLASDVDPDAQVLMVDQNGEPLDMNDPEVQRMTRLAGI